MPAISTEWKQKHALTIMLGRQRCISLQSVVDLSPYRYSLPQSVRAAPSCGSADNLYCGELKVLLKRMFSYAGVSWVLIVTGYKSSEAFASKDLEVDVTLKWCPKGAEVSSARRKLRLKYKLHVALAHNSALAADTNGWATWSTGAFDIHEGGRVVLDTGELGRVSELDPHYLRDPGVGHLHCVLELGSDG